MDMPPEDFGESFVEFHFNETFTDKYLCGILSIEKWKCFQRENSFLLVQVKFSAISMVWGEKAYSEKHIQIQ